MIHPLEAEMIDACATDVESISVEIRVSRRGGIEHTFRTYVAFEGEPVKYKAAGHELMFQQLYVITAKLADLLRRYS